MSYNGSSIYCMISGLIMLDDRFWVLWCLLTLFVALYKERTPDYFVDIGIGCQ